MRRQGNYPPAKLIIGAILGPETAWEEVAPRLAEAFGDLDYLGDELPFDYTDYYTPEMGEPLRRRFVTVAGLWDSARLADAKLQANSLETAGVHPIGRRYNLDPGLLSLHSLILASTKPHAHRIPLHSGIYAEVTLVFRNGRYRPLPWTYPDYAGEPYQEILQEIRENLKREIKR